MILRNTLLFFIFGLLFAVALCKPTISIGEQDKLLNKVDDEEPEYLKETLNVDDKEEDEKEEDKESNEVGGQVPNPFVARLLCDLFRAAEAQQTTAYSGIYIPNSRYQNGRYYPCHIRPISSDLRLPEQPRYPSIYGSRVNL